VLSGRLSNSVEGSATLSHHHMVDLQAGAVKGRLGRNWCTDFTDLCMPTRVQTVIVVKNIISLRAAIADAIRGPDTLPGALLQAHPLTAKAIAPKPARGESGGSRKWSAGSTSVFTSSPGPDFIARIAIFSSGSKH